jgi:hypothetical protein
MIKYLLFLVLLAIFGIMVSPANAEGPVFDGHSCTFSWDAPITRTDGSVLDEADISGYQLNVGRSKDMAGALPLSVPGTSISCADIPSITYGQYYATVTTVDNDGIESVPSDTVPFMFKAPNPSKTTLTIE